MIDTAHSERDCTCTYLHPKFVHTVAAVTAGFLTKPSRQGAMQAPHIGSALQQSSAVHVAAAHTCGGLSVPYGAVPAGQVPANRFDPTRHLPADAATTAALQHFFSVQVAPQIPSRSFFLVELAGHAP
jgi:hypothetical protein